MRDDVSAALWNDLHGRTVPAFCVEQEKRFLCPRDESLPSLGLVVERPVAASKNGVFVRSKVLCASVESSEDGRRRTVDREIRWVSGVPNFSRKPVLTLSSHWLRDSFCLPSTSAQCFMVADLWAAISAILLSLSSTSLSARILYRSSSLLIGKEGSSHGNMIWIL